MVGDHEIVFGLFRLDCDNQQLWRGEQPLALQPKPLAVLQYLALRAGRLVTKEGCVRTHPNREQVCSDVTQRSHYKLPLMRLREHECGLCRAAAVGQAGDATAGTPASHATHTDQTFSEKAPLLFPIRSDAR